STTRNVPELHAPLHATIAARAASDGAASLGAPLAIAALHASTSRDASWPGPTGATHSPSGPSSPTARRAPACIATHTCTAPCRAPRDAIGTATRSSSATATLVCTGLVVI